MAEQTTKKREPPVLRFWYGKGAKYKSIEELIDNNPSWFIWAVDTFQDITPKQAKYWQDKYPGLDLPEEVIVDVDPFVPGPNNSENNRQYSQLCVQYRPEINSRKI